MIHDKILQLREILEQIQRGTMNIISGNPKSALFEKKRNRSKRGS